MKVDRYLLYDLKHMAAKGLFNAEQPLKKDLAQLHVLTDVPGEITTLFTLVGDVGSGVQIMTILPINKHVLNGQSLVVSGSAQTSFELYVNNALEELIVQLNQGRNRQAGFAPAEAFTYKGKLFQWLALSL